MERKSFTLADFKADSKPGRFKAVVAVFGNVDRGGDRIIKGAFQRTLEERGLPPIYHSHQWNDGPIGATTAASETDAGLEIEGDLYFEDDPLVKRIYRAMKDGVLREFSFAYDVIQSALVTEDEEEVRELRDLDLFEVGPTLVGMNPATQLVAAPKSLAEAVGANAHITWAATTTGAPHGGYVLYPFPLPATEPTSPDALGDSKSGEQAPEQTTDREETRGAAPFIELPRLHSEGDAQ